VAKDLKTVIELTAAGQLRIYTVFPFNPNPKIGNQKRCEGSKNVGRLEGYKLNIE